MSKSKEINEDKKLDKLLTRLKKLSVDVYITRNGHAVNKDTQYYTKLNKEASSLLDRYFNNTHKDLIHIPDIRVTKKELSEGVMMVMGKKVSDPIYESINRYTNVVKQIDDDWHVLFTEHDEELDTIFKENEPVDMFLLDESNKKRSVILTRNVLPPVTTKERTMLEYNTFTINELFGLTVFKLKHEFGETYAFFILSFID